MFTVTSIRSDSILVIESEAGIKKYETGNEIEFETKEGFVIKGVLMEVHPDKIIVFGNDTYTDYELSKIKKISFV